MALRRATSRMWMVGGCAVCLLAMLAGPAQAAKTRSPEGSLGPTFGKPMALAVDRATGDVLVVDQEAGTVSRWQADGTAADFPALGSNVINGSETPQGNLNGFGGYPTEIQIAVDNSETASDGNIYVTQSPQHLVDVFSREGAYLGQLTKFGTTNLGETCGVGVDDGGAVYVGDYTNEEIHKYVPSGPAPVNTDDSADFDGETTGVEHPCTLALGTGPTAGSIFVDEYQGGGSPLPDYKLDSASGASEYIFGEGNTTVAVDPTNGHVLGAPGSTVTEHNASGEASVLIYPPLSFGGEVRGLAVGPDGTLYIAHADSAGISVYSPLSEAPPRIEAQWVSSVSTDEATVQAALGPEEQATTYHVEYMSQADFEANGDSFTGPRSSSVAPLSDASVGSAHIVTVHLQGLTAGTTYYWRFVASSSETTFAPARTVTTFSSPETRTDCPNQALRTGPSAKLPDCRAYEMVSPIDKNGGDADAYFYEGFDAKLKFNGLDKSTPGGGKLAYTATAAFAGAEGGASNHEYIATRGGGGWGSESIDPPMHGGGANPAGDITSQFKAFSEDLCQGWLVAEASEPLTSGPAFGYRNLYRRSNCSTRAGYTWLESSAPEPNPVRSAFLYPDLQGVASDGRCAVFRVNDQLPGTEAPEVFWPLYLWCEGGSVRLVSRLPNGTPFDGNASAGTESGLLFGARGEGHVDTVQHALSRDGTRVYWTASSASAGASESNKKAAGKLYLRVNAGLDEESAVVADKCVDPAKACTVQVSPSGFENRDTAQFWTANSDGTRAIFSISGGPDKGNLYEHTFDPATGAHSSTLIAGKTLGVAGASEDAERLYFASEEVCGSEPNSQGDVAVEGEPNLYRYETGESCAAGQMDFVGTLAGDDTPTSNVVPGPLAAVPRKHVARASANGGQLLFVSAASLTDYDNADAASGEADREVYLYDAEAARGPKLRCVSCNPSGARPHGAGLAEGNPDGLWTAAYIPGYQHQLYGRRLITAGGNRVFFNSLDALSIRDTNGAQDVYQWEAPGTGTCRAPTGEDPGSPTYSARSEGCVDLISSGKSAHDSEWVESSASGEDVFIRTEDSLIPKDPGSVDIYDARVNGGFAEPAPAPTCEGDSCQSVPSPPPADTPASEAFHGPGNQLPERGCGGPARRAAGLAHRARRLRHRAHRAARHGAPPARTRKLVRRARRLAHRAKGLSARARRCRGSRGGTGR